VVEDSYCAIKRDLLQIRHEGDDTNIIFWRGEFRVFMSNYRTRFIQNYKISQYVHRVRDG
jgi:hypothetical protein